MTIEPVDGLRRVFAGSGFGLAGLADRYLRRASAEDGKSEPGLCARGVTNAGRRGLALDFIDC